MRVIEVGSMSASQPGALSSGQYGRAGLHYAVGVESSVEIFHQTSRSVVVDAPKGGKHITDADIAQCEGKAGKFAAISLGDGYRAVACRKYGKAHALPRQALEFGKTEVLTVAKQQI